MHDPGNMYVTCKDLGHFIVGDMHGLVPIFHAWNMREKCAHNLHIHYMI
jgi:hypothetical protein